MIAAWMAYAILLGAAVSLVALAAERAAIAHRARVRFVWVGALAITALGPVIAYGAVVRSGIVVAPVAVEAGSMIATPPVSSPTAVRVPSALAALDGWLLIGWMTASIAVIAFFALAMAVLARRRREWRRATVDGHDVLVTPDLGPAVIGVRHMRVLLPAWALALEAELRVLMLTHESEHVRARDPLLLLGGTLLVALIPWNAAAWWQLRRLRLAVELDCDRRVLRDHPRVRRYATLLVAVGARRSWIRLPATALAESRSSLERRIDVMSTPRPRHPIVRTLAAVVVAGVVLAVACDAPRPGPVSPDQQSDAASGADLGSGALLRFQTDREATLLPDNRPPRYPEIMMKANMEGRVVAAFIVDEEGRPDPESIRIVSSSHDLFSASVRSHIPNLTYRPALADGKPVRMWVQLPFTFNSGR